MSTSNIEDYISKRIEQTFSEGGQVIFVCDSHKLSDPEIYNPYPPHCMEGSEEAEIIDTLKIYTDKAIILKKHSLSIILDSGLENILKETNPIEIEITGVCTDICDLFAVYDLRIRGYNVFVSNKGVLPLDPTKQTEYLDYFKYKLGARTD
jgi:nicotinamidase-related amidase